MSVFNTQTCQISAADNVAILQQTIRLPIKVFYSVWLGVSACCKNESPVFY